ncbi:MAG: glycerophosphodiester phosphodiesterase family protein [Deltaproteobacteria bacterium]|nr:glycerophosphodiester phosphodiesterase family protein [Deltaproteobacteria bacterium]
MEIIAHRGNSVEAPENTLPAFRGALTSGAVAVEFDVQLTRDGVPVVVHDETLGRTVKGTGRVGDHTLAQLQALDCGSWFGTPFAGEHVPTLRAVLEVLRDSALRAHIEFKTSHFPYPGLVPAVIREVERLQMAQRVAFSSFNHHTLLEARREAPHIPCAALVFGNLLEPWDYVRKHGFQALHLQADAVDELLVRGCRKAGLALRAYTVNDPEQAVALSHLGVTGIFSDTPRRMVEAIHG